MGADARGRALAPHQARPRRKPGRNLRAASGLRFGAAPSSRGGVKAVSAHIVAIDQGTTSTRAIVFDRSLQAIATAQQEITQHYPAPGLVEHDAEEIWQSVVATVRAALKKA